MYITCREEIAAFPVRMCRGVVSWTWLPARTRRWSALEKSTSCAAKDKELREKSEGDIKCFVVCLSGCI
jgi:hypothetical protein